MAVKQVLTREQFYAKYPKFAAMPWGSQQRQKWLDENPGAAQQWNAIRTVEKELTSAYGEGWRGSADAAYWWSQGAQRYLAGQAAAAPTAPTTPPTPAPSPVSQAVDAYEDPFSPTERNIYDVVKRTFEAYGLGELAPHILEFAIQGYDEDTIELMLQDPSTEAGKIYNQRFAANEARRKAGMRVLSAGEYIQLEDAYRRTMRDAGLPEGFWDSRDDFRKFIENDVDPTELKERADLAARYVANTDPQVKQMFRDYYGIGDGELTAYILDPKRGKALIEQQAAAVSIGAAAGRQGLTLARERAEYFGSLGAAGRAEQAYSDIATILPDAERLSNIHGGDDYRQTEAEDEFLGGLASARRKRERLANAEVSLFAGSGGYSRDRAARGTAGSY